MLTEKGINKLLKNHMPFFRPDDCIHGELSMLYLEVVVFLLERIENHNQPL